MTSSPSASSSRTRHSLVARAAERDAAAWSSLVDLYGPLVASWCRRCGLDTHATADCVQEVFAALVPHLAAFEPTHTSGSFRAWLWTIARNKLRDHYRRAKSQAAAEGGSSAQRRMNAVADGQPPLDDDPTDDLQLAQLVRRALVQVQAEFEPRTWQAFWRSAVDGIPTAVVAEELSLSPAAIRQSRSRVLRRLRRQLGDL
jgi:RNA polymerase sigma-70 factor (ECF subfamily)